MSQSRRMLLAALFIAGCHTEIGAAAAESARAGFVASAGSDVVLQGTTTLGPWTSSSTSISGNVVLNADMTALNSTFDHIQSAGHDQTPFDPAGLLSPAQSPSTANLSVPVMTLRGGGSGMENDLHHALKADQHPTIDYTFQQLLRAELQKDQNPVCLRLLITGQLSMAGARQPLEMEVVVSRDPSRHFHARAQAALKMSDFGVTPPSAFFGLIRTRDQVNVIFDLIVKPVQPPSTQP
jgi:polyisoprenoid-binding protein YceI